MRETRTGEATTPCAIGNPGAFIYDRDSKFYPFPRSRVKHGIRIPSFVGNAPGW
jgi:hypothetical protein